MGSGGCKVSVINSEGELVAEGAKEYTTHYPHPGWAEHDASELYESFCLAVRDTLARGGIDPREILALCIVGVTHNVVLLGEDDTVLRRVITLSDERSWDETQRLKREFGDRILQTCANDVNPIWTLPQLMWIREHEPEVYRNIDKYLFPKDYIRYRITGAYVTDWIDAMGSLLYDPFNHEWSQEICTYLGVNLANLPPAVSPKEIVGRVNSSGAEATGLPEGTPVVCGSSDTAAEVFAAGAIRPGQCTVKLATVGRICIVADHPVLDSRVLNYQHLVEGLWYPGTGTKACASSVRWTRDTFCREEKEMAKQLGVSPFDLMDIQAAKAPPGSLGLLFHPYLLGEQAPHYNPFLRGHFLGISFRHGKSHFLRAVYEGIGFSLKDSLEMLISLGLTIDDVRLIGGGTKSRLWSQIVTDVLGLQLNVPAVRDASFGAALLAGMGVGVFADDAEAVQRGVRIAGVLTPNEEAHDVYSRLFPIYCRAHSVLGEIDHNLCQFDT